MVSNRRANVEGDTQISMLLLSSVLFLAYFSRHALHLRSQQCPALRPPSSTSGIRLTLRGNATLTIGVIFVYR
jgi:hypothetical protein